MSFRLFIVLLLGTIVNIFIMLYCRKYRSLSEIKVIFLSFLGTASGYISVKIMYFIENGSWGGLSFFGGVFFVPLFMIVIHFILSAPYDILIDLFTPAVSMMLSIMKVQCYVTGCCRGRVLYITQNGAVRFPSQIVECVCGLLLTVFLVYKLSKDKREGILYSKFMIYYGCMRFVLNFFRDVEPSILFLPYGNFWSIISLLVGIIWLHLHEREKKILYKKKRGKI